jgi:hypothetical protein
MRLVAYIRAAGSEPFPFNHRSFETYRAALQRQYCAIRSGMDKEGGRRVRLAGRELVRLKTLQGAAGDLVPTTLPHPNKHIDDRRNSSRCPNGFRSQTPPLSSSLASVSRDVWNCKRKLRHVEYLSALLHASRLGDPDLHVYPCPVCAGLHVGHDPDRIKRRTLAKELASIERRITDLKLEDSQLQQRKTILLQLRRALASTDDTDERARAIECGRSGKQNHFLFATPQNELSP